jgi:hypothetical protein
VNFNLWSNSWVNLLQKSEFAAQILGFEKLGFGLDNCGRTTKNANCHIHSLWCEVQIACLVKVASTSKVCQKNLHGSIRRPPLQAGTLPSQKRICSLPEQKLICQVVHLILAEPEIRFEVFSGARSSATMVPAPGLPTPSVGCHFHKATSATEHYKYFLASNSTKNTMAHWWLNLSPISFS